MKKTEAPVTVDTTREYGGKRSGHHETRTTHPAFGVVSLVRIQCNGARLFGSDLVHGSFMRIRVSEAHLNRSLNDDRPYGTKTIVEFDLSLAQFTQFVASQGMGEGTPCTLAYYRDGEGLVDVPYIAPPEETHNLKFDREMRQQVEYRTRELLARLEELRALVETGGKVKQREAVGEAIRHAQQLPGSVTFINEQFTESMENITQAAKTEIEGFVTGMAIRTGIAALKDAAPKMEQLK